MGLDNLTSAVSDFFEWVAQYDPFTKRQDPGWTPGDYVMAWPHFGNNAAGMVAGRYKMFLKVLVIVTAECYHHPTKLDLIYTDNDGVERRVSRPPRYVPYMDMETPPNWTDEDDFRQVMYDRRHKGWWKSSA